MSARVAVVILSWNGKEYLRQFLPSVTASSYKDLEIVVADNGSTDGTGDFINQFYPGLTYLNTGPNMGFATGYNRALTHIKADYYILLNQDVEVLPGWLEPLISEMEADPQLAVCMPKVRSFAEHDAFEYAGAAGGWVDKWGYPFCRGRIFEKVEKDHGQYDWPAEVAWASGAAFLIRAPLFHQFGGLDDHFFAHMEEIDLCWRLKNAGYKIKCFPASIVWHVGGGSLPMGDPRKTLLNFRNSLITIIKNAQPGRLISMMLMREVLDGIAGCRALLTGRLREFWAIQKAQFQVLFKLRYWLKVRREIRTLVEQNKIGPPDQAGFYKRSIVWDYFLKRKRKFSNLDLP